MTRTLAVLAATLIVSTSAFSQLGFQGQTSISVSGSTDIGRARRVDGPVENTSTGVDIASIERIAFDLLNAKRMENGLSPLVWSDEVAAVARRHSQDMVNFQYFSHKDLNGNYVSDRADNAGIRRWKAIGENIAFNRGYKDPIGRAVELWMESESHRHNLLDSHWRESGIGIAIAKDGSYFLTQVFLLRK